MGYSPGVPVAYYSVVHLEREVYYGALVRGIHSQVASFVFLVVYPHILRALFYGSYLYSSSVMWTGILGLFLLMAVAFMGYVLPWGQMSYWGATVIINLLSGIPCMVPLVGGGYYIHGPLVTRLFVLHFLLPLLVLVLVGFHVIYIHSLSSCTSLGYNTNSRIHFYPWLVVKDIYSMGTGTLVIGIQVYDGCLMLAHPDNTLEVSVLSTPLHIVPEWYFLVQYGSLKAIPGKYSGLLCMVSLVVGLVIYGEPYSSSSLLTPPSYTTGRYFIWSLGPGILVTNSLWVGVQLPQYRCITRGRVY